jgi:hypothetical protein
LDRLRRRSSVRPSSEEGRNLFRVRERGVRVVHECVSTYAQGPTWASLRVERRKAGIAVAGEPTYLIVSSVVQK